ncbi:hypothetical protein JT358_05220 [Micrococcales bacterium 31B]|nr:hypothetical protein [Micrococcales bacterium 31B]
MKITKQKIIASLVFAASFGAVGALAANAQSLPNETWSNINPGSISARSWSSPSSGVSRTNFVTCGLNSGAQVSIPNPTWIVRHAGAFGLTAYVGEKSALCSLRSASYIDWGIGAGQAGNQLTLARSVGTLKTTWNVADR